MRRTLPLRLVLLVAPVLSACVAATSEQPLELAVSRYNQGLRWKRLTSASELVVPERRSEFVRRYLAHEDDLHIENIEVRAVNRVEGEATPTFDVTVVAEAYLMPSTVLEKTIITERWQRREGGWQLVKAEPELVPAPMDKASASEP